MGLIYQISMAVTGRPFPHTRYLSSVSYGDVYRLPNRFTYLTHDRPVTSPGSRLNIQRVEPGHAIANSSARKAL